MNKKESKVDTSRAPYGISNANHHEKDLEDLHARNTKPWVPVEEVKAEIKELLDLVEGETQEDKGRSADRRLQNVYFGVVDKIGC